MSLTPARSKKIETVLAHRQKNLCFVLENVDDPHNIGAILRSCDAFGVLDVHLLYTNKRAPRMKEIRSKSAASAVKWLRIKKWDSVAKLTEALKKKKFKIVVTDLSRASNEASHTDLIQSVALVIGNEHAGISPELAKAADLNVRIPMVGFVQSFNASVAAAILLYEAFSQRQHAGCFEKPTLNKKEQASLLKSWTES